MLLAASQRAFWLRPPAISRRDMMNVGGSAVERLICGITAAGAAIGACVTTMSAATIFGRKGPLCPRPLPLGGVLPRRTDCRLLTFGSVEVSPGAGDRRR